MNDSTEPDLIELLEDQLNLKTLVTISMPNADAERLALALEAIRDFLESPGSCSQESFRTIGQTMLRAIQRTAAWPVYTEKLPYLDLVEPVQRVLHEWHDCGDGMSVDPPLVEAMAALKAALPAHLRAPQFQESWAPTREALDAFHEAFKEFCRVVGYEPGGEDKP